MPEAPPLRETRRLEHFHTRSHSSSRYRKTGTKHRERERETGAQLKAAGERCAFRVPLVIALPVPPQGDGRLESRERVKSLTRFSRSLGALDYRGLDDGGEMIEPGQHNALATCCPAGLHLPGRRSGPPLLGSPRALFPSVDALEPRNERASIVLCVRRANKTRVPSSQLQFSVSPRHVVIAVSTKVFNSVLLAS